MESLALKGSDASQRITCPFRVKMHAENSKRIGLRRFGGASGGFRGGCITCLCFEGPWTSAVLDAGGMFGRVCAGIPGWLLEGHEAVHALSDAVLSACRGAASPRQVRGIVGMPCGENFAIENPETPLGKKGETAFMSRHSFTPHSSWCRQLLLGLISSTSPAFVASRRFAGAHRKRHHWTTWQRQHLLAHISSGGHVL